LRVVIASGLDRTEAILADVAALTHELDREAYCCVGLGVVRGAMAVGRELQRTH
jgi:hypothetical protein